MWCIPKVDQAFLERMEHVLDLYEKPYNPGEPVVCFDEKSKQLLRDIRVPVPPQPGKPRLRDYEYKRNGTRNIFLAVEPKAGYREVQVTKRRTKQDFAKEVRRLAEGRYRRSRRLHLVLDNLNTHFATSFRETFGEPATRRLLKRLCLHHTPKHASWLNMAEIEMSILGRQCLNRRIPTEQVLIQELAAWKRHRNRRKATISWRFTTEDARRVFRESYPTNSV